MAYDASRANLDAFPGVPSDTNQIAAYGFTVTGIAGGAVVSVLPWAQRGKPNPTPVVFPNCVVGFTIRDFGICGLMAATTATVVMIGPT